MRRGWFERAAQSMAPADVAEILLQAIREERFYIYTDHEWDERVQTFCDDLLHGTNPVA
jgi:hypothetical protein